MARLRFALAALLVFTCAAAGAHDIPADIRIVAFVKPERDRLTLLMRVPLSAMNDVDVPMRGPGYLDLARAEPALRQAARLWLTDNLEVFAHGVRLAQPAIVEARVSLAADRSFGDYASAAAHLHAARIPEGTQLFWSQQLFDVRIEYPMGSAASEYAIRPRFEKLAQRVATTVHFIPAEGTERTFELHGDPGVVALDPTWHQTFARFVRDGFVHILDGIDHLLFIACLVIPLRKLKPLIVVATAFTVAHSITLACAATGLAPEGLWFPPLVETLIAVSVLWLAIENVFGSNVRRRWMVAFAFGLVHGFGFAFALRESLQFAGAHLATALLAFNVGVELGQIAVLLVLVPALGFAFKRMPERPGVIVLSALIAHTAWHWTLDRFADLRKFGMPPLDAATLASAARWAMAVLAAGLLLWIANRWVSRLLASAEEGPGDRSSSAAPDRPA